MLLPRGYALTFTDIKSKHFCVVRYLNPSIIIVRVAESYGIPGFGIGYTLDKSSVHQKSHGDRQRLMLTFTVELFEFSVKYFYQRGLNVLVEAIKTDSSSYEYNYN